MKIFFDTNILLDVLFEREPFYKHSAYLWSMAETESIKGYISAITVNNVFYITKKASGQAAAERVVDAILEIFNICPLDYETLKLARTIKLADYEDLIQYFSAINSGSKYLVTRNKKDFPAEGIKLVTAEEFCHLFY